MKHEKIQMSKNEVPKYHLKSCLPPPSFYWGNLRLHSLNVFYVFLLLNGEEIHTLTLLFIHKWNQMF